MHEWRCKDEGVAKLLTGHFGQYKFSTPIHLAQIAPIAGGRSSASKFYLF
jgi:hypothetical protein